MQLVPEKGPGCPCRFGILTLHLRHWTVLCYSPLRPLRLSFEAETVPNNRVLYGTPGAQQWSKDGLETTDLHIFLTSLDDITLKFQPCADVSQPCCQLVALRHPLDNLNSDFTVTSCVTDTSRSILEWWNCSGDGR